MSARHPRVRIYTDGWQGATDAELLASHGLHTADYVTIPSFRDYRVYAVVDRVLGALPEGQRRALFAQLARDLQDVVERLRRGFEA